jgi:hypothetical protein
MPTPTLSQETPITTARALMLERIHYLSQQGMDMGALVDPDRLRIVLQQSVDRVLLQYWGFVWAERVQTQSYTVVMHYPASWWQMARAQARRWALDHVSPWWMPDRVRWALQRLDVRTRTVERHVEFTHFLKWPELMTLAMLDERRRAFNVKSDPVSETRVGGSWAEGVESGKWWEE